MLSSRHKISHRLEFTKSRKNYHRESNRQEDHRKILALKPKNKQILMREFGTVSKANLGKVKEDLALVKS